MIGKSLVLLCVALGIAAGSCVQFPQYQYGLGSSVLSNSMAASSPFLQMSGSNLYGNGFLGNNVISTAGAIASDGPETAPLPVIQAPPVTLPEVQTPVIALPSQPVPAPRVISQRCVCTKTVVKPQVYQRQVTVPKVQRYLKRTVTPIVENVTFKSRPISSQVCGAVASAAQPIAYNRNCYSRVC